MGDVQTRKLRSAAKDGPVTPTPAAVDFLQLVQNLPAAVYATDAKGRITFFNDAAATLWGRRPALGEDWWCGSWRLYWPDGAPMRHDECPMAVALKTGKGATGTEAIAERPDGTRFPFAAYPTPLRNDNGDLVGAVNMLVDLTERTRNEEAALRLAAIVELSDDAIISKDLRGVITSWNKAAERLFGYKSEEIVGKPVTTLMPPDRQHEELEILGKIVRGERIEHYETVRQRKDGSLIDISLTTSPVKNAEGRVIGASKIVRDITARRRIAEQLRQQTLRLATINQISKLLSRDLDLERIIQTVTDVATGLIGAKFGAFFYNLTEGGGEAHTVYTVSGEGSGMPRNSALFDPTFRGTGVVRSDDIRADPRYGKNTPHIGLPTGNLPVVSYLAVPVIGRSGDVLGGLFFGHDQPGVFKENSESMVVDIASHAALAIDNARLHKATEAEVARRRAAEEAKEVLLNEIQHRVRNTLATVHAIAAQTFRRAPNTERESFGARLRALAGAHDLLTRQNWDGAAVGEVVERALEPFRDQSPARFRIEGHDALLSAKKALLTVMILHELGTNAVKYGALSSDNGRVSVTWELTNEANDSRLRLHWRESGGPPVQPPDRKGFGSTLIERALEGESGKAQMDFNPSGLVCVLDFPI